MEIVADTAEPTSSQVKLATVKAKAINGYEPEVGDYVLHISANAYYVNPVVKFIGENDAETGIPAITIYTKRDVLVEADREASKKQTSYYADKHAVVALTNAGDVVLLYATVA